MKKIAIVVAEFNALITDKMLEGALEEAYSHGLKDSQIIIKKSPRCGRVTICCKITC